MTVAIEEELFSFSIQPVEQLDGPSVSNGLEYAGPRHGAEKSVQLGLL